VKEIRGKGLIFGFDIEGNAWPVLEAAIARADLAKEQCGLLMLSAGANTLRLLPPYTLTDGEIEQGVAILEELLN
jgi:acetylornithine/succinyldiaminopimelate/putrescine aminotransferase